MGVVNKVQLLQVVGDDLAAAQRDVKYVSKGDRNGDVGVIGLDQNQPKLSGGHGPGVEVKCQLQLVQSGWAAERPLSIVSGIEALDEIAELVKEHRWNRLSPRLILSEKPMNTGGPPRRNAPVFYRLIAVVLPAIVFESECSVAAHH